MSAPPCTVTRTTQALSGDTPMQFESVYTLATVRDLCEAASDAGELPSALIEQVWLRRVPTAPEG